jgi:phage repressor protein C with HTH and peptisase S24 domain/DNA-binding XRE family transcriptional regulator
MNLLAERIKRTRKNAKMSQAQLAEACGWKSQSRVGNYEAGTREPSFADIEAMAKALGVDKSDLLIGLPPEFSAMDALPAPSSSSAELVRQMLAKHGKNLSDVARQKIADAVEETATQVTETSQPAGISRAGLIGDEVWIAHYDIRAAMGGGQIARDFPEMLHDVRISPQHLRELGVTFESPDHLKMVTGWGQSMEPTIKHRDPLIVDVSIREFSGDGIYLFSWDDHLYIKRLQVANAEHFEMISDNAKHKDRLILRAETYIQARVLLVWNAHLV